jgi:hypothetical protein
VRLGGSAQWQHRSLSVPFKRGCDAPGNRFRRVPERIVVKMCISRGGRRLRMT